MVDRQPDYDPVIQDFLQQFGTTRPRSIWRIGRSGRENEVEDEYVSFKTLQEVLTHQRIKDLLNALFRDEPMPDAGKVRNQYLRSFAILLCIGAGRFIYNFTENYTLRDIRLPFREPPHNFPTSTTRDLFVDFVNAQWAFCPFLLEWDISYDLGTCEILPINYKEEIEDGGSAVVWKVGIDEEYDKLIPRADDSERDGHSDVRHQNQHTYVVKTYRAQEAQKYFATERDAFRRLRYNGLPAPNIIEYYGSFIRDGVYNIVLEYADLKTLDQFMESQHRPRNRGERSVFWEQCIGIIKGLLIIHGENASEEGLQIFHGWHQDVDPTNILVKSRSGTSVFDSEFKVADLGLSHFKKHHPSLQNPTDRDTFGTTTYGPPESRRSDVKLETCKLQVTKDVDIWSLGCVLSEVATWVHQGWDKVIEYRRRRREEMKEATGSHEDCFHNGHAVLQAVHQIHDDIIENRLANDNITHRIVGDLIPGMLLVGKERSNAKFLYDTSIQIIREASTAAPSHGPHSFGGSPRSRLNSSGLDSHYANEPLNVDAYGRYAGEDPAANTYADVRDRVHRNPSTGSDVPVSRTRMNNQLHSDSANIHQGPAYPQQRHINSLSQHLPILSYPDDQQRLPETKRSSHSAGISYSTRALGQIEGGPSTNAGNLGGTLRQDRQANGDCVQKYQIVDASHPGQHMTSRPSPQNEKSRPVMSVQEGLSFIGNSSRRNLPHQELFQSLDGRDHVFLIDHSESMGPYRTQVRDILKLLAHMLRRSDPDGLDIYFTTDSKKIKPKDVMSLLKGFDKRPNTGAPDMRERFAAITERYQSQLGKKNRWNRIFHPKHTPRIGPRRLNLYVLTDGVWQPKTNLIQEIETLVDHLLEHKLTNKQIGIQFITFGNVPQGIRRLQKLDSDMRLKLDIVDTTAADDNVWKMVLGPINAGWDDDNTEGDDDDVEDEIQGPSNPRTSIFYNTSSTNGRHSY